MDLVFKTIKEVSMFVPTKKYLVKIWNKGKVVDTAILEGWSELDAYLDAVDIFDTVTDGKCYSSQSDYTKMINFDDWTLQEQK